ncbi:M48 family metallopeptidase [Saccharicrinis sp. FJH2]|uniref:M48 family metallopeptidase n=1 Tax=unclassified Saccharicrinis TaxID=2646859 RepID=UPI0035D42C25
MSEQKVIAYPDFGPVTFRKNKNAKHISIRIKPGPLVFVTLPYRASIKEGQSVLVQKKAWVIKKMYELEETETIYRTGKEVPFKYHTFNIIASDTTKIYSETKEKDVTLYYPDGIPVEAEEVQEVAKEVIREIWRNEAKIYIPQRITWLSHSFGFMYQNVSIRDARTRWGSCTGLKNISISLYIMRLPHHLIDYVLLHELCHTVVPNHGKNFYALMDKVTKGRTTEYQKEMRAYKPWL